MVVQGAARQLVADAVQLPVTTDVRTPSAASAAAVPAAAVGMAGAAPPQADVRGATPVPVTPTAATAAAAKPAVSITQGFELRSVSSLNCPTTCSPYSYINGGTANQALCAWRFGTGNYYYGVWMASTKACYFTAPQSGVTGASSVYYTATSGYLCACINTGAATWVWRPSSTCISGSAAASSSPAVCRYHKYGDTNTWTMGWIVSATSYCFSPKVAFNAGGGYLVAVSGLGGSNFGMQVLCRDALPSASCYSEAGWDYGGGDYKYSTSITSAQLCCNQCSADTACKAWTWNSATKVCYFKRGVYSRTSNSIATSGVPNRLPDYRKCIEITPTRPGLVKMALDIASRGRYMDWVDTGSRWAGINGYVCPPNTPATSDCSAFTTWLYWAAFGKTTDYMNGDSWSGSYSYTGTQSSHGTWVAGGKGTSYASAQLGDLVFYGAYSHKHVAMYLGGGKVASFGQDGPLNILNIDYRSDRDCIKSFPKFFV